MPISVDPKFIDLQCWTDAAADHAERVVTAVLRKQYNEAKEHIKQARLSLARIELQLEKFENEACSVGQG